jgi:hypothetical protein
MENIDNQPSKRARTELPTKDEQKQLQQVELLMKSNLLQLQIDQLLDEVCGSKNLGKKKVTNWVESLLGHLNSKETYNGGSLSEGLIKSSGLGNIKPLKIVNTGDESINVEFFPPVSVDVVGSYEYQTSTTPKLNVDISVTMPADMFDTRYGSYFLPMCNSALVCNL